MPLVARGYIGYSQTFFGEEPEQQIGDELRQFQNADGSRRNCHNRRSTKGSVNS